MELRQLRYFITVGQLSSITQAAELLHTSQPNITTAIQKLERELGISLFARRQKRLYLTPEGEQFLARVRDALSQIQAAAEAAMEAARLQRGKIRIGVPPSIGAAIFPAMLSQFKGFYPGIELAVTEEGTWLIVGKIEADELDLGMIILTAVPSKLNSAFLTRQQIMVCLPPGHHLSNLPAIRFNDLRDEPLIMMGEHSYHRHLICREFEHKGITPNVLVISNQVETIKGLVARRMGISFMFEILTREPGPLCIRPLDPPMFVDIGLAWKKGGQLSTTARTFIQFFQNRPLP